MAVRKDNGQGSMYFDEGKGYWYAEIQWKDSSGTKKRKKFSGKSKTAVKKKLDEFKKQLLLSGPDVGKKSVIFQDFAENWLNTKLKNSLKPTSFMRKKGTFQYQVYPHLGGIPIEEISSEDIQNMVNRLIKEGLSYSSIKKAFDNVNGCLREYRITTRKTSLYNPCEAVVLPEAKKHSDAEIVFYSAEEIPLIYNEATRKCKNGQPAYYHGLALVLLMFTGMRVGEALALEWNGDIDFTGRTISITKNVVMVENEKGADTKYILLEQNSAKTYSGSRVIPMSDNVYRILKALRSQNLNSNYVLSTRNGNKVNPRNLSRTLNSILKKLNMVEQDDWSGSLHALRHTFASMMFEAGAEVKMVSDILGHSNTKITENIYIHIIQKQRVKTVKSVDEYTKQINGLSFDNLPDVITDDITITEDCNVDRNACISA